METTKICATLMVLCLFLYAYTFPSALASTQKGPRSGGLDICFYYSPESCFLALQSGAIDIMAWPITADSWIDDVEQDSDLVIAPFTDSNMIYGFNFNINETIKRYSAVKSPFSSASFRTAVACLIDKDYIADTIFSGNVERIDVPLPTSQSEWWNTSVCYPNYPYEYNITRAEQLLDENGFNDTDSDGYRNYPVGWPQKEDGPDLDPIVFYADQMDLQRYSMALALKDGLETVGIPVDFEYSGPNMYTDVMLDQNYHIFSGAQIVNSYPVYLSILAIFVFLYASFGQSLSYGASWQCLPFIRDTLQNAGLSQLYKKLLQASSWEDAIQYTKQIQSIYTEHCFEVPVCSVKGYFAYSKNIAGIVGEKGYGIDNPYTFLNAYRTDDPDAPIRVGLVQPPNLLNILYSDSIIDYQCLDKIYTGLISYNPYDTRTPQPWIAQDWEMGTWIDAEDNEEKTVVTYYLRDDVYWVQPGTGYPDGLFTAKDYEFTCYYVYAQLPYEPTVRMGCPHYDKFKDIHHIEIVNDIEVRVYMNITSMWAYQLPTYPLLPKHVWLDEPLAYQELKHFEIDNDDLPGELSLSDLVVSGSEDTNITVLLSNGTLAELQYGEDFTWKKGAIYVNVDSIDEVEIDELWASYWKSGNAMGYTPANLPWEEILEGCGSYFALSHVRNSYLICNSSRNFFLETPPLGEIDWRWIWDTPGGVPGWENPGRDGGCFQIQVYDVVKATASYCHYGTDLFDPDYFPGADIDDYDLGHVGIYDIALITSKYGLTWGNL